MLGLPQCSFLQVNPRFLGTSPDLHLESDQFTPSDRVRKITLEAVDLLSNVKHLNSWRNTWDSATNIRKTDRWMCYPGVKPPRFVPVHHDISAILNDYLFSQLCQFQTNLEFGNVTVVECHTILGYAKRIWSKLVYSPS